MGYYFGRSGLGALGDAETETECPQPVSTAERDALRDEIRGWTNPSERAHFVEGHPDIGAVFDDIVNRLRGLENRPKLLRCEREARDRAGNWLGQLDDLGRRVRPNYPGAGFTAVPQTFQFTVFRGPTYTIRSDDEVGRGSGAPPVSSAPPGSVVVGGQVYATSQAAAAATQAVAAPTSSPASSPVATVGGGVWTPPAGYLPGASLLEGSVAGIPMTYLVYGGLALFAWRMMKGR